MKFLDQPFAASRALSTDAAERAGGRLVRRFEYFEVPGLCLEALAAVDLGFASAAVGAIAIDIAPASIAAPIIPAAYFI